MISFPLDNEILEPVALSELARLGVSIEEIERICVIQAHLYLPHYAEAAMTVASYLLEALSSEASLSLVRVGNSEGNMLALASGTTDVRRDLCLQELYYQGRHRVSEDEVSRFSTEVWSAIASADIIGLRTIDSRIAGPELAVVANTIRSGNAFGALGILHAREYLLNGLEKELFKNKIVTSAWIHLSLIEHIQPLIDKSRKVIAISGRPELEGKLRQRSGDRFECFLAVPGESEYPADQAKSHLHEAYPRIIEWLRGRDLRGTLVLVGAGLFGKVYCQIAKESGAVAVDIGSSFDLLAGIVTRPVHSILKIDSERFKWK